MKRRAVINSQRVESFFLMGRRHEDRLQVNLPVRVWGMDRNGKPFIQSAHVVDVTRLGGRLRDLYCLDKKGDVIRVQHGSQKANFKITWIGHPGTSEDGQVGIYCIEPDKYIWGVPLPKRAGPDAYDVEQEEEFVSYSEQLASQKAFQPTATASPAAAAAATKTFEDRPGKKRQHPRYACNGTVEVAPEGSTMPVWCMLSDISMSGCYAETTSPLPAHTKVHVLLKLPGMESHARAVVRTSHAGVGMGIGFTHFNTEDESRLQSYLERLKQDAESGNHKPKREGIPSSFAAPATQHEGPPKHDRSMLVAHNRPAGESPRKKPMIDPELAARLQRVGTDLWEAQQMLQPKLLDERIVREFKAAVDHARQAAWAVQHWLELQSQNRDPFHVLHKLHGERLRDAREICRNLTIDIDSGEIDVDQQGLDELLSAVKDLQARLARLLNR